LQSLFAYYDNKKIDCKKPSIYRKEDMLLDSSQILATAFITDAKLIADNFDEFLKDWANTVYSYLQSMI